MADIEVIPFTDTDWRALCAELLQAFDDLPWEYDWKGNPVGPLAEIDDVPFERARAALAQPEPEGPTDEELVKQYDRAVTAAIAIRVAVRALTNEDRDAATVSGLRAVLARWGRPAIQPVPVVVTDEEIEREAFNNAESDDEYRAFKSGAFFVQERISRPAIQPVPVTERFEFSVFDSEYEEQAGGTAPTYSQALSEGQHYLAVYSQDGPHSLELRRVEVFPHQFLPLPTRQED